jgi:threonine/homoserine/homoserine lactone efflux protein
VNGPGSLIAYGFVLGWSVAWPPGPINAEMMRRGLAVGFRPAVAVGLGACSGDALWAIAVMLGIGVLVGPGMRFVLMLVSTVLLLVLAALFLSGAWQAWRQRRVASAPPPSRVATSRGGYLLGLGMALSSPWNLAFWLAVMGRPQSLDHGFSGALTVAGAVILGAASWCLVFCGTVTRARPRLDSSHWHIIAQGLTGLLMLGFAVEQLWLLITV